jgi:hypothetical protein
MRKGPVNVVDIIKKVSAVALPVLVDAAKELIAGEAYAAQRALLRQASPQKNLTDQNSAEIIGNDTDTYVQTNFANSFSYYYAGLGSQPALANAVVTAANDDILIWDPHVQGGLSDIDKYLQLESLLQNSRRNMVREACSRVTGWFWDRCRGFRF